MVNLASDQTAASVLSAVPCYAVPPFGASPAIDALRNAHSGHGLAVGKDGVMLILRRPWLEVDALLSDALPAHVPYGSVGRPRAALRCGLIPGDLLDQILAHFLRQLPNEAAAFVLWNASDRSFRISYPKILEATPSRLVYSPPAPDGDWHVVCDLHSHGRGPAFFSATDDADDMHATKIAVVAGRLGEPNGVELIARLCAGGMFLPMPRSPFSGDSHAG